MITVQHLTGQPRCWIPSDAVSHYKKTNLLIIMEPRQGHGRVCPGKSIAKEKTFLRDLDSYSSGRDPEYANLTAPPNILISGHLKFNDSKELTSEKPRKCNTGTNSCSYWSNDINTYSVSLELLQNKKLKETRETHELEQVRVTTAKEGRR